MYCRLAFYTTEWELQVRSIKLDHSQTGFVFSPSRALDFFQAESV